MPSNNIYLIIFILVIIAIIVYFYYHNKNTSTTDIVVHKEEKIDKKPAKKKIQKKVRFNDDMIDVYSAHAIKSDTKYPKRKLRKKKKNIDVDKIVGSDCRREVDLEDILPQESKVVPMNLDTTDPEQAWYSNFGLPLMAADEKKKFYAKMQKNHKNYENALGEFTKYQTDSSTIIKTDTTINPFAPEKRSNRLKGKAIKDIYDEKTAGPKAKPKKIRKRTDAGVTYEDESEMNGGFVCGSTLHGFDGVNDDYKMAAFGNEF